MRRNQLGLLLLFTPQPTAADLGATPQPNFSNLGAWSNQLAGRLRAWTQKNEKLWRQHEAMWRHRRTPSFRPPSGAVYVGTMHMPVIGKQSFVLKIRSRQRCQITLIGVCVTPFPLPRFRVTRFRIPPAHFTWVMRACACRLELDEPASYMEEHSSTPDSDVLNMVMFFNKPTLDLLRRWRTRIKAVRWHNEADYATLVVAAPLIPPIHIKLRRTAARDAPSLPSYQQAT